MQEITNELLAERLQELIQQGAFELHKKRMSDGTRNIYIPYMMNDALECYILLKNARITGKYNALYQGETTVKFANDNSLNVLIFHQGRENVFTLWFEHSYEILECYRYADIGHFWVNDTQHWRRLVYVVGTIYDKYKYLGKSVCSEKELALLPLMEFAAFRHYSPISDSLDNLYENTQNGFETMFKLAFESNDSGYLRLLKLYKRFPRLFAKKLVTALNKPARQALYELICSRIQTASSEYSVRRYGVESDIAIVEARNHVSKTLYEKGFSGEYPLFYSDNMQIFAAEEHPFTILDWDDYAFRIQFMVSEGKGDTQKLHYGFFKNHGRIEDITFIERI